MYHLRAAGGGDGDGAGTSPQSGQGLGGTVTKPRLSSACSHSTARAYCSAGEDKGGGPDSPYTSRKMQWVGIEPVPQPLPTDGAQVRTRPPCDRGTCHGSRLICTPGPDRDPHADFEENVPCGPERAEAIFHFAYSRTTMRVLRLTL